MAHRGVGTKATGPRGRQMAQASWARIDRAVEKASRRQGKAACEEGRRDATLEKGGHDG